MTEPQQAPLATTDGHCLIGGLRGSFVIETLDGTQYVLDADARTLLRLPAEHDDATTAVPHVEMPRDIEPQRLVSARCRLGQPAHFVLAGVSNHPAALTHRHTSTVIAIRPLLTGPIEDLL